MASSTHQSALTSTVFSQLDAIAQAADDKHYAVALSGGGDSLALLVLALEWAHARRASRAVSVSALIVDHNLRAGSAEDAARAAQQAESLGGAVRIITLSPPDGTQRRPKGGQSSWRERRYRALAAACESLGSGTLLLGHTRDDQAELLAMRAARPAASVRGLAGMELVRPFPVWPEGGGLIAGRPLLTVTRSALRAFLRARDMTWLEDPANTNRRFERVRARTALKASGTLPRLEDWTAVADAAQALECRIRAESWRAASESVSFDGTTGTAFLTDAFAFLPTAVRERLLEAVMHAVSGRLAPVPRTQLGRLEAWVSEPDAEIHAQTLAGVLWRKTSTGWCAARDPGAVYGRHGVGGADVLRLKAGEAGVWDGRWRVRAATAPLCVAAGRACAPAQQGPEQQEPESQGEGEGLAADPSFKALDAALLGPHILTRVLQPDQPRLWRAQLPDL